MDNTEYVKVRKDGVTKTIEKKLAKEYSIAGWQVVEDNTIIPPKIYPYTNIK